MKKVRIFISLTSNLRNAENFGLHKSIVEFLETIIAQISELLSYFEAYKLAYEKYDEIFKRKVKFIETELIAVLNRDRMDMYHSIKYILEGGIYSHNPTEKKAAARLLLIMNNYKPVLRCTYGESVALYYNLIKDLRLPEYAEDIALFSLTEHIGRMETYNNEFKKEYDLRSNKKDKIRSAAQMKTTRRAVDEALKRLVDVLNPYYITNETILHNAEKKVVMEAIIDKMNAVINQAEENYYRHVDSKKSASKPDTGPEHPGPVVVYEFTVAEQIVDTGIDMKVIDANPEAFAQAFDGKLEGSVMKMRDAGATDFWEFPFKSYYKNNNNAVTGLIVDPPTGKALIDPMEGVPVDEAILVKDDRTLIVFINAQRPSFID